MEIIISFEILRLQIFRHELKRSSEIDGKSPLGIGSGDEYHRLSGGFRAFEQHGFDSILLLVALEKVAKIIVSDLSDESGLHSEDGCACDCICCGAACNKLDAHRFQRLPDFVAGFHVNMLHTSFRKVEFLEEFVVRKHCKYVSQCIPDAEYRCHICDLLVTVQRHSIGLHAHLFPDSCDGLLVLLKTFLRFPCNQVEVGSCICEHHIY